MDDRDADGKKNPDFQPPRIEIGWDFQIILISWGIYDIYLIFIEGHYILNGENDIEFRETWNKLADIFQNVFLISSLIVSLSINDTDPNWRIACVLLFGADTLLSFVQFMAKKDKKFCRATEERTILNRVEGTIWIFLFSSYMGEAFAFATLICMYLVFDPWYRTMFVVFIGSNVILIVFTFMIGQYYLYCKNCCEGCNAINGKNFVNFVYGLTFGIFSVYFAPIADIILIYMFFRKCCFRCSWIPVPPQ